MIKLPDTVNLILSQLENSGYEAYCVGGCVRDSLMGKEPSDWDICTAAKPHETAEVFENFKIVNTNGLKHGTVTVVIKSKPYEITTFRTDGEYLDNRRPENVTFVESVEGDLARRDFTVNAMAYNPEKGLTDLFGGAGAVLVEWPEMVEGLLPEDTVWIRIDRIPEKGGDARRITVKGGRGA